MAAQGYHLDLLNRLECLTSNNRVTDRSIIRYNRGDSFLPGQKPGQKRDNVNLGAGDRQMGRESLYDMITRILIRPGRDRNDE
jgi:hypothetical protein